MIAYPVLVFAIWWPTKKVKQNKIRKNGKKKNIFGTEVLHFSKIFSLFVHF